MWENQGKSGKIKEKLKFIQGKRWPGVGKYDLATFQVAEQRL